MYGIGGHLRQYVIEPKETILSAEIPLFNLCDLLYINSSLLYAIPPLKFSPSFCFFAAVHLLFKWFATCAATWNHECFEVNNANDISLSGQVRHHFPKKVHLEYEHELIDIFHNIIKILFLHNNIVDIVKSFSNYL